MSGNKTGAGKPAPGKGLSFFPALFLPLALVSAIFLAGCATRALPVPTDPFAILEDGAAVYAVFPAGSHRPLLELLARKQKDGDALLRAFDRTDLVYASFSGGSSLRLLALGDFPRGASSLYFPASKGWKKKSTGELGGWYSAPSMDAAVPRSGMVLLSSAGGMEAFLGSLKNPVPVSVPPSFAAFASNAEADGRIGVFLARTDFLAAAVLGPDISLPVLYAELYALAPDGTGADSLSPYLVSARIVMQDARTARAMATLLRVTAGGGVRLEKETVHVDSVPVTAEKLVEWAGKLYFY